jgi:hypothetical protein
MSAFKGQFSLHHGGCWKIPFSYLGGQKNAISIQLWRRENPLILLHQRRIPRQIRDSPELDMVAGADDSFNSQQQQFVFF